MLRYGSPDKKSALAHLALHFSHEEYLQKLRFANFFRKNCALVTLRSQNYNKIFRTANCMFDGNLNQMIERSSSGSSGLLWLGKVAMTIYRQQ